MTDACVLFGMTILTLQRHEIRLLGLKLYTLRTYLELAIDVFDWRPVFDDLCDVRSHLECLEKLQV